MSGGSHGAHRLFPTGKGLPGSTGRFSKLTLKPTAAALAEQVLVDAKIQIYRAAAHLSDAGAVYTDAVRTQLDQAKRCIWEGENYKALAMLEDQTNERMVLLSKAVILFCKVQVLAAV